MSKREYGTGSLFQIKDGRWVASWWDDDSDGVRRRRRVTSRDRAVVERKLEEGMATARPTYRSRRGYRVNLAEARKLGRHTDAEWRAVVKAAEGICTYCDRPWERLAKDHRDPVSRGGSDSIENLAASCTGCNLTKGNKTEAEYREYLTVHEPPPQMWKDAIERANHIRASVLAARAAWAK